MATKPQRGEFGLELGAAVRMVGVSGTFRVLRRHYIDQLGVPGYTLLYDLKDSQGNQVIGVLGTKLRKLPSVTVEQVVKES